MTEKSSISKEAQQELRNVKSEYDTAYESLTTAIRLAAQDSLIKPEEKREVDLKFSVYQEALKNFTAAYQSYLTNDITELLKNNAIAVNRYSDLLNTLTLKKNDVIGNHLNLAEIPVEYQNELYEGKPFGQTYEALYRQLITPDSEEGNPGYFDSLTSQISGLLTLYQQNPYDHELDAKLETIQELYKKFLEALTAYTKIRWAFSEYIQNKTNQTLSSDIATIKRTMEFDDKHISFLLPSQLGATDSVVLTISANAIIFSKEPIWKNGTTGFTEEQLQDMVSDNVISSYFTSKHLAVSESDFQKSLISDTLQIGSYTWEKRLSADESGGSVEHLTLSFKSS